MPVDLSQFQNCTTAACSTEMVAEFHLSQTVWGNDVVFDEPVLPNGKPAELWRKPSAIVVVRNRQTGEEYQAGRDYSLTDGKLVIPGGSQIPVYPNFQYAKLPGVPKIWQSVTKKNKPLRIESTYQLHQVAVTYVASAFGNQPVQFGSLPRTQGKIANGEILTTDFLGDSITEGSDSTKAKEQNPNQPGWVDLTAAMLSNGGDGKFYWRNLGVGGWSTNEGLPNLKKKLDGTYSDLMVIGFGMNDTAAQIPLEKFEENTREMIREVRRKSPETEFLLVSTWLGNQEWKPMNTGRLFAYRRALLRIVNTTKGVAMADMTTMSKEILEKKSFYDVTANGVNHPADWMYVAYAQVVAEAIRGQYPPESAKATAAK